MKRAAVAFAALVVTAQALAQPVAQPAKRPPAPNSCPPDCSARSAIETSLRTLAAAVERIPEGTVIAAAALETDTPAPRAGALAALLTEQLAARLGPGVRLDAASHNLAEARERADDAAGIVLLQPHIRAGRLHLEADVYAIPRTVWARARSREPRVVKHAHSHAAIDAEVRSYLEALSLDEPAVSKYQGADPDIVALACGDLDGDGVSDVVTMTRRRVLAVRLREGKVARLREARWDDLAPIAPVPLRQPLGFVTIVEAADRAGSVRLDPRLALITRMQGKAVPLARATGCTWVSDLLLGEKLAACDERDPAPPIVELKHRSDAFASTYLVAPDGSGRAVAAMRREGALVLRSHAADAPPSDMVIGRAGAQIAVADLDQDGAIETISTMDVLAPRYDALEVRTLLAAGTVKLRFKLPVPTGIQALAACPADGSGPSPIVLATARELWVVR
jgi:hypothetical protein